ncbi:MAG TPA: hypothetical protein VN181_15175 [Thermoanaerobaculia bacterium]|nr:hypothetical protein [Thermoanaerobaculia bacterium]
MRISATLLALVMALPLAAAPKTIEVPYGKAVKVNKLTITFAELAQESRCPRTVTCIWAGEATIRLVVRKGSKSQAVLLSTHKPTTATAFGCTIELVDLTPYPEEPGKHDARAYRAKLTVGSP